MKALRVMYFKSDNFITKQIYWLPLFLLRVPMIWSHGTVVFYHSKNRFRIVFRWLSNRQVYCIRVQFDVTFWTYLPSAKQLRQGNVFTRVCHSVHGGMGLSARYPLLGRHPLARQPPGQTPLERHPPGRYPLGIHPRQTPLSRHPLGRHPPRQTPSSRWLLQRTVRILL